MNTNDTVWIDLTGEIYSDRARCFIDLAGKPETRDAVLRLQRYVSEFAAYPRPDAVYCRLQIGERHLTRPLVTDQEFADMVTISNYVAKRLRGKSHRECQAIERNERFAEFVRKTTEPDGWCDDFMKAVRYAQERA